ncbi:hypothetical protein NLJ89_g8822 [Agrocybe chaxingu]|uniref:Roadblock/LAMTOR2 domain-containing protein n=1 Tax=Agrocybe chaxingu TaxID=84603 RepID=A0A9W8JTY2_9AGAR|nr:hypothetical protein NLJ89_g8822 [Agrocybe chaxingu]
MALRSSTTQGPPTSTGKTPFVSQSGTSTTAGSSQTPGTSSGTAAAMSPELEQTLSMLSSHRSVLGYMLITRGHHPSIIRHSGVVFEGEQGKRYAAAVARIVQSVQHGLEEVRGDDAIGPAGEADVVANWWAGSGLGWKDEVRFMRIRTKRHEIMISPDERYILAVLHDPAT